MHPRLLDIGYSRPRIKLLPSLKLGAEIARSGGYSQSERVTHEKMEGFDPSVLLCSSARIVTDRGVHVCPILIEKQDSLLAPTLRQAMEIEYPLRHQACDTCWLSGAICANASTSASQKELAR